MIAGELENTFLPGYDGFFGKKKELSEAERKTRKANTIRDFKELGGFEGLGKGLHNVGSLFGKRPQSAAPADFRFQPGPPAAQDIPDAVWYVGGGLLLLLAAGLAYRHLQSKRA